MRKKRCISSTGIYHVVIKGLNQQVMFEEEQDYRMYMKFLVAVKTKCPFVLYAYCMMSNHIHLVVQTADEPLDAIFRKINTSYAMWFNEKYGRSGHLQQNRYYSEPIETEQYFINAVCYVHRNPYKAGLEAAPGDSYKWNSIHEYSSDKPFLVDRDMLWQLLPGIDICDAAKEEVHQTFLDYDHPTHRFDDIYAKEIMLQESGCTNTTEFQSLDEKRKEYAFERFYLRGMSIKQIVRLTGASRRKVENSIQLAILLKR